MCCPWLTKSIPPACQLGSKKSLHPPANALQFEGELALVKRRKVLAVVSLASSPALVPALAPLLPLAVHATAAAPAATPLLLRGRLLCGDQDLVLARQQGANLTGAPRFVLWLGWHCGAICRKASHTRPVFRIRLPPPCSWLRLQAQPSANAGLQKALPACPAGLARCSVPLTLPPPPAPQLSCWAAARSRGGSGSRRACWACCPAVLTWRCSTATSSGGLGRRVDGRPAW